MIQPPVQSNPSQVQMTTLQGLEQTSLYPTDNVTSQRLNRLIKCYGEARSYKQFYEKRWKENYEYYLGIDHQIKAREKHQSKVFVPRPYLVVETKTPRLVKSLLSKDPIFTVKPQSKDDEVKARIWSEALSYQLSTQENINMELTLYFKDSFIYGGAIGQTGWQFCQEMQTRREQSPPMVDPISMQLIQPERVVQEAVVTIDRPYFKNIDIGDIFPDPHASTIEDCKYIIKRSMVSFMELQKYAAYGLYTNLDKIPRTNATPMWYDDFASRRFSVNNISNPYRPTDPVYDLIELLEFYWMDDKGGKTKTVIANQAVIIQDIPLPYWHNRWPFYLLKDIPMTNEFWGLGEFDPIKDLIKDLNDVRNYQNDIRNQYLKAFWVVDRNANVDLDELANMPPGGILEVTGNPAAALNILRPPNLDQMTFGQEQKIDSDIQMTTGANDIAIGTATRSQVRNATTGSLLADSVDTRYGLTALLYLEQLRKVGRDWLALNQQFMTQPVMVRILGEDGINMIDWYAKPYDIPRQFDLYIAMGTEFEGDKEVQKQQKMQLFSVLSQVPGFNITEFAKEIMYAFGIKNPERFFEGSFVIPTDQIMQQMGMDDKSIMSSYQEQTAGLMGGGTQSNPRQGFQPAQAASKSDVLQMNGGY